MYCASLAGTQKRRQKKPRKSKAKAEKEMEEGGREEPQWEQQAGMDSYLQHNGHLT